MLECVKMKQKIRNFKKNQILEEAVEMISEFGFHRTTMDKLCEKLDVSKPFLYSYFDNKSDLLIEIYDRIAQLSSSGIKEIITSDGPPAEKISKVIVYLVKLNIDVQDLCAIYMQEEKNLPNSKRLEIRTKERQLDESFTSLIEQGVTDGVFEVAHPRIATLSIFSMARWVHRWYRPGAVSADEIASDIANYALNLLNYNGNRETKEL